MSKKYCHLLGIAVLLLGAFACNYSVVAVETNSYPSELGLGTGESLKHAQDQRSRETQIMIQALCDKALSAEQRCEAAQVLGVIRAEEAISALLENLTIQRLVFDRDAAMDLSRRYPCFEALKKLGRVASEAIVDQLEKELPKPSPHLLWILLRDIESPPFARLMLERRMKKLTEDTKKERLQSVVDKLIEYEKARANDK